VPLNEVDLLRRRNENESERGVDYVGERVPPAVQLLGDHEEEEADEAEEKSEGKVDVVAAVENGSEVELNERLEAPLERNARSLARLGSPEHPDCVSVERCEQEPVADAAGERVGVGRAAEVDEGEVEAAAVVVNSKVVRWEVRE